MIKLKISLLILGIFSFFLSEGTFANTKKNDAQYVEVKQLVKCDSDSEINSHLTSERVDAWAKLKSAKIFDAEYHPSVIHYIVKPFEAISVSASRGGVVCLLLQKTE